MKINVSLYVGEEICLEDVIEIEDAKMEPLSEDETQDAIEINVREWANRQISIAWETKE